MMIIKNKYRQDRKLLQNTFGCTESSFNKKKYKPGLHKSTKAYSTFYGKLLNQRQKLKAFYKNLKDKQLKKLVKNNMRYRDYKSKMIKNLESRIDTVLFRSGMIKSFSLARQLINHRHVKYSNRYILSPSQKIINNNPIEFSEVGIKIIKQNLQKIGRSVPGYIHVNHNEFKIIVDITNIPTKESELRFATKINLDQVIQSYRL